MDLKVIKQVVDLMKRSELSEFEFEEEGFKLRLSRKNGEAPTQYIQSAPAHPAHPAPAPASAPAPTPSEAPAPADEKGTTTINSPMVGTFYCAGSPESPPFVKPGDKVRNETVVCIIEAMKVMNEIQAEMSGTVVDVLAENGEAVEYGQPLFKIKTS